MLNSKYIIPKDTDIDLMITFLNKVNSQEISYKYTNFLSEFKNTKNNLNFVKTETVSKTINRTYNFLKNINAIKENENGILEINKEVINTRNIKKSFESFLKKEFSKYIKSNKLRDKDGKLDKTKIKELTKKILEENKKEGKEIKDTTVSRDSSYFYNFLNLINREDFSSSLMYTRVIDYKYELNTKEDKLDLARNIIIGLANIHDVSSQEGDHKTKLKILKKEILNDEFLDSVINKNYNGDVDLFLDDIQLKDIPEPDYASIIANVDKGKEKILEYVNKGYKVLVLTDSDNDGSNALVGANRTAKYLQEKYGYKFSADYAKVVEGSLVNHGPNFAHLEEMRKGGVFNKNDKILFITADSFSNSQVEAELILKNYPNSEIIATDHHSPKEGMKTLPNDRLTIINYLHESQKEKLHGFSISGAHTFNVLMTEFLKELPEDENKDYIIQQLDSLNRHSNFMDMVHAHPASRIKTMSTAMSLSKNSNLMNAVMTMLPLWENYDKISPEFFEKNYFATKLESESLYNEYLFIFRESEIINKTYNNILRSRYETPDEVRKELLTSLRESTTTSTNYKSFPSPMYLRTIMLDFITKNSLTAQEQVLFEYLTEINGNFLMNIKNYEKKLMRPLKEHVEEISETFEDEKAKMILVKNKHRKNGGKITRKFYLKTVPQSNDGILMIFDTVTKDELKGSIRMIGTYKFNDVFNVENIENRRNHNKVVNDMIKEGILTEDVLKDNGLNIKIEVIGHEEGAAGIYVKSIDGDMSREKIKILTRLISNKFKEIEKTYTNQVNTVYDRLWLNDMLKIFTVLKFPTISSGHSFKPDVYVKANTIPFTQGVETLAFTEELAQKIDKVPGWEISPLSFDGNTLVAKTTDLKRITDGNYLKLNFMSPTTLMSNNIINLPSNNLKFIPYLNTLNEEQFKMFDQKFTKNNNYTTILSKDEFVNKNPLINGNYSEIEQSIMKILKNSNRDEFVIIDTEGTGFGNFAKVFDVGMTRFLLSKDKKSLSILYSNIIVNPDIDISIAAENLTGITNEDIKKRGLNNGNADKVLEKIFKKSNAIFVAHNASYDISILMSSLPKFSNIVNDSLVIDTAPIARNENLAFDEREKFGSITVTHKGEQLDSFKTFLLTDNDENNAQNFFDLPLNKKSIANLNNDIRFEWEFDTIAAKHVLIIRESKHDNKKIILGSEDNLSFGYKSEYKAKKFSIVAMLMQTLTNIIRSKFSGDIIPNKSLINYLTNYKFIDEKLSYIIDNDVYLFTKTPETNIENLMKYINKREIFDFIDKISLEEVTNGFPNSPKMSNEDKESISILKSEIEKMNKTANYEERKNDKINKFVDEFALNKITTFVKSYENLAKNANKYSFSSSIKTVIENYNSNLNMQENIFNIRKESSNLSEEFIKNVIDQLYVLNAEMSNKPGIKELMEEYKVNTYSDLFHENHNNIEPFLSDTTLEGISVISNLLSKYQNDPESVSNVYIKEYIDTEYKKVLRNLRNVPSINTFSFSQLLSNDFNTERNKKNKQNIKEMLEQNMAIVKISEDTKILVKLKNDYTMEELETVGKRIEELARNLYDYQVYINTYDKHLESLFKSNKEKLTKEQKEAGEEEKSLFGSIEDFNIYGISLVKLEDILKNLPQQIANANPKSKDTVILNKVEKAKELLEMMIELKKELPLFKDIYEQSKRNLESICDYSVIFDSEVGTKKYLETIKNITHSIMDKKIEMEKSPSKFANGVKLSDFVNTIFMEESNIKDHSIPIDEHSFDEIMVEVNKYIVKIRGTFANKDMKEAFEKAEVLFSDPYFIDKIFDRTNQKPLTFDNNMNEIVKTSNSDSYKLLLSTYKKSVSRINNTKYLLEDEMELIDILKAKKVDNSPELSI
jgi:hypothetical protein